ncbi:uncharacterized protein PG986_009575 [Apiospora aurea]|uniref:Uncharacterized protein n=1 Tax=Apiospora aurea TaxID=335848 RepID=A0ABR1Q8G3_9PEZI
MPPTSPTITSGGTAWEHATPSTMRFYICSFGAERSSWERRNGRFDALQPAAPEDTGSQIVSGSTHDNVANRQFSALYLPAAGLFSSKDIHPRRRLTTTTSLRTSLEPTSKRSWTGFVNETWQLGRSLRWAEPEQEACPNVKALAR